MKERKAKMNYITKIEGILRKDYDHEIPDKPRSVEFNRAIKSFLKKTFPGCTILPTKGAWCQASGFIQNTSGKTVYYSFQDYRYGDWKQRILIRKARDEKDYTGGANHYTDINRMYDDVMMLM